MKRALRQGFARPIGRRRWILVSVRASATDPAIPKIFRAKRYMNLVAPKIKVLLVDDEEGYLEVLSKRLSKRGLEVMIADRAVAGIQALRRYRFDVAVIDLKMEDLDGLELLNIFKTMAPDLQVIILTGHGSRQAAVTGLARGAFDYLYKPCELETLLAKIWSAYKFRDGSRADELVTDGSGGSPTGGSQYPG